MNEFHVGESSGGGKGGGGRLEGGENSVGEQVFEGGEGVRIEEGDRLCTRHLTVLCEAPGG